MTFSVFCWGHTIFYVEDLIKVTGTGKADFADDICQLNIIPALSDVLYYRQAPNAS